MPTGEALKPERDPPGVLTGRTGKKEAPWVGLTRLPSFQALCRSQAERSKGPCGRPDRWALRCRALSQCLASLCVDSDAH